MILEQPELGSDPPNGSGREWGAKIHIDIPSKNMQFLLWNPTCHEMR